MYKWGRNSLNLNLLAEITSDGGRVAMLFLMLKNADISLTETPQN